MPKRGRLIKRNQRRGDGAGRTLGSGSGAIAPHGADRCRAALQEAQEPPSRTNQAHGAKAAVDGAHATVGRLGTRLNRREYDAEAIVAP